MNTTASRHPVEAILVVGLKRLLMWGIPLSALTLVFGAPEPSDGLLTYNLVHLTVLQVATALFAMEMASLTDQPWFEGLKRRWLASTASLIAAVVGFSALLTLATSAAARYDPSLQFLQLLSSLDIAWVVAGIYLGSRKLWGRPIDLILGLIILAACVGSIALYLKTVGFSVDGGWLVDGPAMSRIVLPADTVAALLAVAILLGAQRTEQPRPQS